MAVHPGLYLMAAEKRRSLGQREQSQLDDALAALLVSTKRTKRILSLIEVNEKLRTAERLLGGLRAVAHALGLSDETVRQFRRIEKLSPDVRKLVATRQITSMDLADRLSRFAAADQHAIAAGVVSGTLDACDVRAILALRKANPRASVQDLIRRIRRSRNITEYVAEFLTPQPTPSLPDLQRRLSTLLAPGELRGLEVNGRVGRVIFTTTGKKALEAAAGKERLTKRELLQRLIDGEATQRARR
jgi:hypothetical protein